MTRGELGFLLQCHADSRIARIVDDRAGLLGDDWIGRPFTTLIAAGALAKALDFFTQIATQGAQYYWEMPVAPAGRSMVFIGAKYEGGIAIAASSTPDGLDTLVDELMRLSNEQANIIRVLSAEKARSVASGDKALEELTRLNIEYANMQRELARKNAELARANDRKGLMLGMAAHDLRNPLQVISGFSEYLKMRASDRLDEAEIRFLDHILESSARMRTIIDDVLSLSRSETGRLVLDRARIDIAALLGDIVTLQGVIADDKGIVLAPTGCDAPVIALVDSGKLRQVVDNLITNAIKFSMPDTAITVSLVQSPEQIVIAVTDQGPGIPAEELPRLFQPFSRTSVRSTAGEPSTGLGLAISKSIVEGHGGRIAVHSVIGQGTTFTVTLPRG